MAGMLAITDFADELKLQDGYWRSSLQSEISYPEQGNLDSFRLEENSFWFKHRNEVISRVMERWPPEDGVVFDVGGGNGFVSCRLQEDGFSAVVIEPGYQGVLNSMERGVSYVIQGSFEDVCLKAGTLPSIGLFDVLEHIEHDVPFLEKAHVKIKTGGLLYLTVPAHESLWSSEDEYGGHFRRYTKGSLERVLEETGFEIVFISYFFSLLPFPIFIFRRLPWLLGFRREFDIETVQKEHRESALGRLLLQILGLELGLLGKGRHIPLGASIVAVGRKTS